MSGLNDTVLNPIAPECVTGLASVVIPTYNRASMIEESIRSALDQSYRDLEVIVVDDESTDDTAGVVLDLVAEYGARRLRCEKIPKSGAQAARNRGLELSRGEFIQFLDSDDLLHRDKIENQVAFLNEHDEIEMTYCVTELFSRRPGDLKATRWVWTPAPDLAAFIRWPSWHTNSPLWRRGAAIRVGPWHPDLLAWQDWEYHVRAISLGIRAAGMQEVLSYLREHEDQRIDQRPRPPEKLQSFFRACELVSLHLDRIEEPRGPAREALANRLRGVAQLFFEEGARNEARRALRLSLAQKPSRLRRGYTSLLHALTFVPLGAAVARAIQALIPWMAAVARRLGLLPPDKAGVAGESQSAGLEFRPRP